MVVEKLLVFLIAIEKFRINRKKFYGQCMIKIGTTERKYNVTGEGEVGCSETASAFFGLCDYYYYGFII